MSVGRSATAVGRPSGRFAPSPTGPLHLGSLLAAVASYLDARSQGIDWQVRLDDLDVPRNEAGADRAILNALEQHGLLWDGPVVRQSERIEHYRQALAELEAQGRLFYCRCSRRTLANLPRYPGTCRACLRPRADAAVRVRVSGTGPPSSDVEFEDLVLGPQRRSLDQDPGDFIVRRRDSIFAYHLATAVDDGAANITRVVRGRDLLPATAPQIYLMRCLGLSAPRYGHILLLLGSSGQKLSKQNHAAPLNPDRTRDNLLRVLGALGLPVEDPAASSAELLSAAVRRFELSALPRTDLTAPGGS